MARQNAGIELETMARIDGWATLSPPLPGDGPITNLLVEDGRVVAERDQVTYELVDRAWVEIRRMRDG